MTDNGTTNVPEASLDQNEQPVSSESSDAPVTPSVVQAAGTDIQGVEQKGPEEDGAQYIVTKVGKKRVKRKTRLVNAEDVMPRPSFWPVVLALGLSLVLFGVLAGPIVIGIGVVLLIVSILGWVLERR